MRNRQSLLCILAAVVVVITAAGSNAIELVGRATMVQADSIPMGLPGDTVWDFSGVRPLPGSKTWVASKMGDSVLAVACGDSQLTYLERNDSLYWLGFENPSTEMRETGTVRAVRPSAIAAGVQPHKYTGKELDREAGLDLYDFAARQLDPALGRTTTQDPLAEKYYSISPYTWCASNPISHTDPTGCIVKYDMTEKEYGVFKENFDMLKQSEIFNNFFSALENNPDITVTIGFGKTSKSTMKNTDDEVPGEYDPETKMVTSEENQELASSTVAEELYHAYQDMSGTLVDGKENVEYEAKVAAILSCGDASTIISHIFQGIEDLFFDKLSIDYIENRELLQSEFRSTYVQEGQKFVEFFKQNSMSTHYSMPVTTVPDTLLKVLNLK